MQHCFAELIAIFEHIFKSITTIVSYTNFNFLK